MILTSSHKYTSTKGQTFKRSVTEVTQSYMPDFPKEAIAEKIASRDGLEAQDIIAKWDLNADISSRYGTALHNAIEYWLLYQEMPNQLSDVVGKFAEMWEPEGSVTPEISLYDEKLSLCGTVDIFEFKPGEWCKIHDIKTGDIHKDAKGRKMKAPFNNLEASKLNQYRLQLSIYKHLVELQGGNVTELVIWWWNGKWEKILLEPISVHEIL